MAKTSFCGGCYVAIGDKNKLTDKDFYHHLDECAAIGQIQVNNLPGEYSIIVKDKAGYDALIRRYNNPATQADVDKIKDHLAIEHIGADIHANLCTCSYYSRAENNKNSNQAYIYLIKHTDKSYASYKIGISTLGATQNRKYEERLFTHMKFGWQLVALWTAKDKITAYACEQAILRSWRTRGFRPHLRPRQMKQGGYSETVAIAHFGDTLPSADINITNQIDNLILCQRITGAYKIRSLTLNITKQNNEIVCISGDDIGLETYTTRLNNPIETLSITPPPADIRQESKVIAKSKGLEDDELFADILFPQEETDLLEIIIRILKKNEEPMTAREIAKGVIKEQTISDVEIDGPVKKAVNRELYKEYNRKSRKVHTVDVFGDEALIPQKVLKAPLWVAY